MNPKHGRIELCEFLTRFMSHVETELRGGQDIDIWEVLPEQKLSPNPTSTLRHKPSGWCVVFEIDEDLDVEAREVCEEDCQSFGDDVLLDMLIRPTSAYAKQVAKSIKEALGDAMFASERKMTMQYLSSVLSDLGFTVTHHLNRFDIAVYKDSVAQVWVEGGDVRVAAYGNHKLFKLADPTVHIKVAQEAIHQLASIKALHALQTAFKANVDYEAIARLIKPQLPPAGRSHLTRIFNQIGKLRDKLAEISEKETK